MIDIDDEKTKELDKWLADAPDWLIIDEPIDVFMEQKTMQVFGSRVPRVLQGPYRVTINGRFY